MGDYAFDPCSGPLEGEVEGYSAGSLLRGDEDEDKGGPTVQPAPYPSAPLSSDKSERL